ncbi:hypothetical protein [Pseudomonas sp. H9]|uniref:hypothetical protein n=1 Tax=Pseudomonas sp. H9 TaxID=483968 RepID=UPI001057915B|nr:hypothetical protein [Pseudomonas sp. H9]TDF83791.1 hypothetical protein E1573_08520 [Pseudomonas sp. H9]
MTSYGPMHLMRLIRSSSFNDELAAELLRELSYLAPTAELTLRILDIAEHMDDDSRSLEQLYQALASGQLIVRHASDAFDAHCAPHERSATGERH